ncbi:nucleotidyltransferase domain-containing protein [Streptomyces sp. A7024]|uniref:Nucleotidyltransferase domain-containing protein n=1 Tax=Streptomyces coryli TaxID=1128680 RepID=A0A6G4U9C7_9ACTN|nr:nucleotidyltransferase domain-containing protein [Streptomyces coryli]NGN67917.1 nucleotidyltransferase domain-containing protein [Streptomyces coryli]
MLRRVTGDDRVAGVVLTGSRARAGAATERSDYDVLLVARGDPRELPDGERRRDSRLDIVPMSLADFRTHAIPGAPDEWNRYAFTHARVLKDTPDGLIARLVAEKGTLAPEEARRMAAGWLDAFCNAVYRWLKNARDGRLVEARLDAAEAVPPLLTLLFALHGRVRPYNKYLLRDLAEHPLGPPELSAERLVPLLEEVLSAGAPETAHRLFRIVEPLARAAGHGDVIDSWGDDAALMRG